jgi:predicted phosphate transport protein (TIGR00153 family)
MPFRLKPKEEKFFEFLAEHAEIANKAAELMTSAFEDPTRLATTMEEIDSLEREADELVEKILKKLHKTFITPFDREDIFALAQKQDNLIDAMTSIVDKMMMYNVGTASDEVLKLASLVRTSVRQIEKAVSYLSELKKQHLKLEARCNRVVALEAEGDVLYRNEMAKLFRECKDPIEIIKWKEILTSLEDILDNCEDITELLKRVVLKYA